MSTPTLVFFDLETGGLDYRIHPIIQFAAIAVHAETLDELGTCHCRIKFKVDKCDRKALETNHYFENESLWESGGLMLDDALARIAGFFEEHACLERVSTRTGRTYRVAQLVAHNGASFDGPFLKQWFETVGMHFQGKPAWMPADPRVLDTIQLAMWKFQLLPADAPRPENLKQGTLLKFYKIDHDANEAHDAVVDCRNLVKLYRELKAPF